MTKLLKMYEGRDGQFREKRQKNKNDELLRPYQCLCSLEFCDENES